MTTRHQKGIARHLSGHAVTSARELGWEELSNGDLLDAADRLGFDVFLTADKNIRYQQDLRKRKIGLVVLGTPSWPTVRLNIERIVAAVNEATPGSYIEVQIPG